MLLGAGELGKEFTLAAQRLGQYVIAVNSYPNSPAMQVADESIVIDLLDGAELDIIINKIKPNIIVPDVETIRCEKLFVYEKQGISVVPSAKANNFIANRKFLRDLADKILDIKTLKHQYAKTLEELKKAVKEVGMPCIVKPIRSSFGEGKSKIITESDIEKAWDISQKVIRGNLNDVLVEEYVKFEAEFTLLTITQKFGSTLFCPAIGQRQKLGQYKESWQPIAISEIHLSEAERIAKLITQNLGGSGIWGFEYFISDGNLYFSGIAPRPHDNGIVTLINTQNANIFELHLKAILGIPISEIKLEKSGASSIIYAKEKLEHYNVYGLEHSSLIPNSEVILFGKADSIQNRKMGVALVSGNSGFDIEILKSDAKKLAERIIIE